MLERQGENGSARGGAILHHNDRQLYTHPAHRCFAASCNDFRIPESRVTRLVACRNILPVTVVPNKRGRLIEKLMLGGVGRRVGRVYMKVMVGVLEYLCAYRNRSCAYVELKNLQENKRRKSEYNDAG